MRAKLHRKGIAILLMAAAVTASCFSGCSGSKAGKIYLYGEQHGVDNQIEKEFELWRAYYHGEGMRDLFLEMSYYDAEFLNIWMQSDDDEILEAFYQAYEGTSLSNEAVLDFYRRIKQECPETVFHGTDVGHAYSTYGKSYLEYLESMGQAETEQYRRAQEVIGQGETFYQGQGPGQDVDWAYRENKMAENFIWEMDRLENTGVMGIYGFMHTELDRLDYGTSNSVPTMATQLREKYGGALQAVPLLSMIEPVRADTLTVREKEYTAQYYGKQFMPRQAGSAISYLEFWRLEDAYGDFKDNTKISGNQWYRQNYPFEIAEGQVYVIRYTMTDGTGVDMYYRCDGLELPDWGLCTEGIMVY